MQAKIDTLKFKNSNNEEYVMYPRTVIKAITNENGDKLEDTLNKYIEEHAEAVITAQGYAKTADVDTKDAATLESAKQYNDAAYANANAYTDTAIANLINGAPESLNTLKELADAMSENEDVVEALDAAIGSKANASDLANYLSLSGGKITGTNDTPLEIDGKGQTFIRISTDGVGKGYLGVDANGKLITNIGTNGWADILNTDNVGDYALSKSGGVIDGVLEVASNEAVDRYSTIKNSKRDIYQHIDPSGVYNLYDGTNGKHIIQSIADGTSTFYGTATGNATLANFEQHDATHGLNTSILEKALEVGEGIHRFRLNGTGYVAEDLPDNAFMYSTATIYKRNPTSIVVKLACEAYNYTAINSYNGIQWTGWGLGATKADFANYVPKNGGIAEFAYKIYGQYGNDVGILQNPEAGRIMHTFNVSSDTEGLFPNHSNANSVLTISRHGGDYTTQLGFSSNGNMYLRNFNAEAMYATQPWKTILDTGNSSMVKVVAEASAPAEGSAVDTTTYPEGTLIAIV